jgi:hypothetical protein
MQKELPAMPKRSSRLLLTGVTCVTCAVLGVVVAGCGTPPGHLVSANLDPCALITADVVSKVVGFPATPEPVSQPATANDITTKDCTYQFTNPEFNTTNGLFVITYPTNVFISLDITADASAAHDDFQVGTEIYPTVQTIHGLGDAAAAGYPGDPFDAHLSVLKDNVVLDIWLGNQIPVNALDLEKQMAQSALKGL